MELEHAVHCCRSSENGDVQRGDRSDREVVSLEETKHSQFQPATSYAVSSENRFISCSGSVVVEVWRLLVIGRGRGRVDWMCSVKLAELHFCNNEMAEKMHVEYETIRLLIDGDK